MVSPMAPTVHNVDDGELTLTYARARSLSGCNGTDVREPHVPTRLRLLEHITPS
jgi:hypothetical protein